MNDLYRAQRLDNHQWVYWTDHGKLLVTQRGKLISGNIGITDWVWELLTDDRTQSRAVGKKDKNGEEIFGGDIIRHFNNESAPEKYELGIVEWDAANFRWSNRCFRTGHRFTLGANCIYEVVGNIHENRVTEDLQVVKREE